MIEIAYPDEELKHFHHTNDIPSTSNLDRHLESMSVGYNTNYTAANSSSITLIGNSINNIIVSRNGTKYCRKCNAGCCATEQAWYKNIFG